MSYIAGAFTATWNASSIGGTREGFRIREIVHTQQIIDDSFGEAPASGIQQGVEVLVTCDWIEYDSVRATLIAHEGTQGDGRTNVGKTMVSLAKSLVLTAAAGTPAAGESTPTWTFTKAIVEGDVELLLSSKLRQGPLTFRCYPDSGTTPAYKAYTKS